MHLRAVNVKGDMACFSASQILEEMRDTVPKEFDFLREAKLMQVIAARAKAAGIQGVVIPKPLMALSSKGLLVMQRMEGDSSPQRRCKWVRPGKSVHNCKTLVWFCTRKVGHRDC